MEGLIKLQVSHDAWLAWRAVTCQTLLMSDLNLVNRRTVQDEMVEYGSGLPHAFPCEDEKMCRAIVRLPHFETNRSPEFVSRTIFMQVHQEHDRIWQLSLEHKIWLWFDLEVSNSDEDYRISSSPNIHSFFAQTIFLRMTSTAICGCFCACMSLVCLVPLVPACIIILHISVYEIILRCMDYVVP